MTFVNSGLLYLLPLAALPIVLHLLTLFRLRTVELSTYRFLFDSYLQQRRRMKLLEALLAMLRTLFLLGLILVLARPMVRHWNNLFLTGSGGREIILLIDCSASMDAETVGVSAFKRAKAAAQAVVKRLETDDRVTLVRVGARSEELFSRFSSDAAGITDKIEALQTTPARANFFAAFMQLFGPEATPHSRPIVYLFTDCQASGWTEARNQGLERVVPSGTRVVMVNVGSSQGVPNQAVLGNAPRQQQSVVGLPLRLTARVANYSGQPAEVMLKTFIDEQEINRQRLALKPNEVVPKHILYTPIREGIHRGRFTISGNTSDRFPADDSFLFAITAVPRVKVLLVNGSPSADPETDEALYLRAVASLFDDESDGRKSKPEGKQTAALRDIARSLDLREIQEPGVTAETLKDASVVVLANCGALNAQQFGWLRDFVAAGGGLLVFPGDKVNPTIYNTQFFPIPGGAGEFLTPIQLGAVQGDPARLETFDRLTNLDFSHPALAVFDEPGRKVPYFQKVLFYKRFPLNLADQKAKAWPLAEFASGGLALAESQYGDGLVVVAAFPLNRQWSNLPTENGKEFVPLVLRLISRVQHRADLEARSAVLPGDMVEISAAGSWGGAVCTVTDPAQPKGSAFAVALERSGSRLVGAFEQTNRRGFYTIEARPEQVESGKAAQRVFAVNQAPEESDFRTLNEKQFKEILPVSKLAYVDATAEAQQVRGIAEDLEEPIWRPLIYLVFVIIGVEFLLATLRGRKRPIDEEPDEAEDRVRQYQPAGRRSPLSGTAAQGSEFK
jgi:hypothetical protein